MNRKIGLGDLVICEESGVVGKAIKFYTPTSCAEQTMVVTDDGRKYHAPTSAWRKITQVELLDDAQPLLNPYGQYVVKFAKNHGMTINEALEQPMVKARLEFFNATGM